MAKEVTGPGRWRPDQLETLRAADADRQQVADLLKASVDEGRLTLHEYDERIAATYAARTYAELMVIVEDLPTPGLKTADVQAKAARSARRMPLALMILWTIWAAVVAVNVVIWGIVAVTNDEVYPWPIWVAGPPGAALLAVTIGVQSIRGQQRRR
jgi:hypothetical protein